MVKEPPQGPPAVIGPAPSHRQVDAGAASTCRGSGRPALAPTPKAWRQAPDVDPAEEPPGRRRARRLVLRGRVLGPGLSCPSAAAARLGRFASSIYAQRPRGIHAPLRLVALRLPFSTLRAIDNDALHD